jgi:hypothetical protein
MSQPLPPDLQTRPVVLADLHHRNLAWTYMKGIRERLGLYVSAAETAALARGDIVKIRG